MADPDFIKLPRLYVDHELRGGHPVVLNPDQAHYLRTVLRRATGDQVRLFNGRDGEWAATLEFPDKKIAIARPATQIRTQPADNYETHLLFAPLKKSAMDFLVEKAVELGVTHLHPVLTQNTEARRVNEDRVRQQIIEAAEQCERLDIPRLLPLRDLASLDGWTPDIKLYAALERAGAAPLPAKFPDKAAFLIGPEGGFTAVEKTALRAKPYVTAVDLGETILRAETAALFCLSARRLFSS